MIHDIDINTILNTLPFKDRISKKGLDQIKDRAEVVSFEQGTSVVKQFNEGQYFYLLMEGAIEFFIKLENTSEEFNVGYSNEYLTPVGWSGFRRPFRYGTTVITKEPSVFLKWNIAALNDLFQLNPVLGRRFMFFVGERSAKLLHDVRILSCRYNNVEWDDDLLVDLETEEYVSNAAPPPLMEVLKNTPFFEIFSENILKRLTKKAQQYYFFRGEKIMKQGQPSEGMYILANGKVVLKYQSPEHDQQDNEIPLRVMSRPGFVIGCPGIGMNINNDVTAIATRDSIVYGFSKEALEAFIDENPDFGIRFAYRLLWLISNQLRASRTHLISIHFERELTAIRNLLEENCTQLSVNSPLHQVPHLLENTITLENAFNNLFEVRKNGNTLEKGLAALCLDMLRNLYKEYKFFKGLKNLYESVVDAPQNLLPKEVRQICTKGFTETFSQVPYVISGVENLPKTPGHIFIFNHLINDDFHTLPNNFQITLDPNFINTMILFPKYGDAGIRILRKTQASEYGHQEFYERLGHASIYAPEADSLNKSPEEIKAKGKTFFKVCGDYLRNGTNLLISPEGTSYKTEDSPGFFFPGVFRLATMVNPEPYIVPVAVANFDKRLNQATFSAVVKEPFKASDYIKDPFSNDKIPEFLRNYRLQFRQYVQEAIAKGWERNRNITDFDLAEHDFNATKG